MSKFKLANSLAEWLLAGKLLLFRDEKTHWVRVTQEILKAIERIESFLVKEASRWPKDPSLVYARRDAAWAKHLVSQASSLLESRRLAPQQAQAVIKMVLDATEALTRVQDLLAARKQLHKPGAGGAGD